jgi:uncharacterized membrane protein
MNALLRFARTTLVGGVLFLVPLAAVFLILGKALDVVQKVMRPLVAHMPERTVLGLDAPRLMAVGVLLLFCFIAGLFARTAVAQRVVRAAESVVLSKMPGYAFLKDKGESLLGVATQTNLPVVLVRSDDSVQLGFRVDELESGEFAVFIPDAPDPLSGSVVFVTADRVQPAGIDLAKALRCLKLMGAGSRELLRGRPTL